MTPTEKFVSELCEITFLPIWSHPNPIGKKGKELCDILIACDSGILIISVKEIIISQVNSEVDFDRWLKRAIEDSVKQIYGAERFLSLKDEVILKDRKTTINLPPKEERNIYRIAVAFGRGQAFPLKFGDFGKGFVHVFDEDSVQAILRELDTITDLIKYLNAKESYIKSGKMPILYSEMDMLGLYILNSYSFPDYEHDVLIIHDDIWEGLLNNEDYKNQKKDEEKSYTWDKLIHVLHKDLETDNLISNTTREELEISVRLMAKESRFDRKILSEMFLEFIGYYREPKSAARIVNSLRSKDLIYVFLLNSDEHKERMDRVKELHLRCFVARGIFKENKTIIGLATERYTPKGYSLDLCYLHIEDWTDELDRQAKEISNTLGYFNNVVQKHRKMK